MKDNNNLFFFNTSGISEDSNPAGCLGNEYCFDVPSLNMRSFNQDQAVIKQLDDSVKTLRSINHKYDGLCELICNYILLNDLLGQDMSNKKPTVDIWTDSGIGQAYEFCEITPKSLDDSLIKNSHILEKSSFITKVKGRLFSRFPCNSLSNLQQMFLLKENKEINTNILCTKLTSMQRGQYLKFEVFVGDGLNFKGHSMLIKKTEKDVFSFFDPNHGELFDLNFTELVEIVNDKIKHYKGKDIALLDGAQFLTKYMEAAQEPQVSDTNPSI